MTTRRWPSALSWAALTAVAVSCADGQAGQPAIQVEVAGVPLAGILSLSFPDTAVAATEELELAIVNVGTGTLRLTGEPRVRLERDDRLAFSVTQPAAGQLASGEATGFTVTFSPNIAGQNSARLVIETNVDGSEELVVGLLAEAVSTAPGALEVRADGNVLEGAFDFGAVAVDSAATTLLTLTNTGLSPLTLDGLQPTEVVGSDASLYSVSAPSDLEIGAAESASLELTFAPEACGATQAILNVRAGSVLSSTNLSGLGVDNPLIVIQGAPTATEDIGLAANADATIIAIADRAANTFAGEVNVADFDGCSLDVLETRSPTSEGLAIGALFGSAVAMSDDGKRLLVTALGSLDAWLYDQTADTPTRHSLSTTDGGTKHGAVAAMDADGTVIVVGQPGHDSGFNAHGAVFVWTEPVDGWTSALESDAKLQPDALTTTTGLGQSVGIGFDTIIATGLTGSDPTSLRAAVYVYVRGSHDEWGRTQNLASPNVRAPSAQLVASDGLPGDGMAHADIARDGATIALTTVGSGGVILIYVFERPTPGWSSLTAPTTESARLRLTGLPSFRAAIAADGSFIVGGDEGGVRQLDRPVGGWDNLVEPARSWPVPVLGDIVLSQGDALMIAATPTGDLAFIWR